MQHFDAVIIGMGPGGEVAATGLLAAGKKVAVVEAELIGGECAYWACIPSKTMIRATDVVAASSRTAGAPGATFDWPSAAAYRDVMVRSLDDSRQVAGYREQGAAVFQGAGRVIAPGKVRVGDRVLRADDIIVATGSAAAIPDIEGLDRARVWTNREVTNLAVVPSRTLIVGGGPVGVEMGQFLSRAGSRVTLVQHSDRLLPREEPALAVLIAEQLVADGVDLRVSTRVVSVRPGPSGGDNVAVLDDGTEVHTDVIVAATGRHPRTDQLGVQAAGGQLVPGGYVQVDEHCRAANGLWAVGDVTGVMPFTHVAKYQARVVVENIQGRPRRAHYDGIPRSFFTDPEAATVGLTRGEAQATGVAHKYVEIDLPASLARPWTYEQNPRGTLGLLADPEKDVLLGAWIAAPLASEWIHHASLAIRAQIPLTVLREQVAQFPTYSEAYLIGLEQLTGE